jgi:hypothetical protein
MASWSDIPEFLKDPTRADYLTDWLLGLPIDHSTRRALAHLWQQHLSQFLYDLRCGTGRDPGPDFPDNIRQMAIGLSQRRIDAIGFKDEGATLFEITTRAGLTAIGQLTAYPILYGREYPDQNIIDVALVAESIQTDIETTLLSMPVSVYLV